LARYDNIPDDDHVLRYAAYGRLYRHPDTDIPISLAPQAFRLRPSDEGDLSLTWIEYFGLEVEAQVDQAVKSYRQSMDKPMTRSTKGAFGKAKVAKIIAAIKEFEAPVKVRVLHDPTEKNPAHSIISKFQDQNEELLELLAKEVFADLWLNSTIPD